MRLEEAGSSESQPSVEQAATDAPAQFESAQTQELAETSSPADAQSESSTVASEAFSAQPESVAEIPPQQSSIEPSENVPVPRWVAENVALSPEEAALELERDTLIHDLLGIEFKDYIGRSSGKGDRWDVSGWRRQA